MQPGQVLFKGYFRLQNKQLHDDCLLEIPFIYKRRLVIIKLHNLISWENSLVH